MKRLNKIYPLVYGIFGSLGFICCMSIFLDIDYRISEHPYAHPFCLIAGSLSLIICMAVFCLDMLAFIDEDKKIRRILRTVVITVISFIASAFMWLELWNVVSEFIKYKGW